LIDTFVHSSPRGVATMLIDVPLSNV